MPARGELAHQVQAALQLRGQGHEAHHLPRQRIVGEGTGEVGRLGEGRGIVAARADRGEHRDLRDGDPAPRPPGGRSRVVHGGATDPVEHPGRGHELRDGRGRHRGHHGSDAVSQQAWRAMRSRAAGPPRTSPPPAPWQWTSMKAGARTSSSDRTMVPEASRRSARTSAGDGSISTSRDAPGVHVHDGALQPTARQQHGADDTHLAGSWVDHPRSLRSAAVTPEQPREGSPLGYAAAMPELRYAIDICPARRPLRPARHPAPGAGRRGVRLGRPLHLGQPGALDGHGGRRPLRDPGGRRGADAAAQAHHLDRGARPSPPAARGAGRRLARSAQRRAPHPGRRGRRSTRPTSSPSATRPTRPRGSRAWTRP